MKTEIKMKEANTFAKKVRKGIKQSNLTASQYSDKSQKNPNFYKGLLFELSQSDKSFGPYTFAKKLLLGLKEGKLTDSQYSNLTSKFHIVCNKLVGVDLDALCNDGTYSELLIELSKANKDFNPYAFVPKLLLGFKEGNLTNSQYSDLLQEYKIVCAKLRIESSRVSTPELKKVKFPEGLIYTSNLFMSFK